MKRASVTATMALALSLLFSFGCAGLIIRPDDSAGSKVGKFTARFFLGAGTGLLSERIMIGVKSRDYERRVNLLLRENIGIMSVDDAISYWGAPSSEYKGDEMYSVKWFGEGAIEQSGYFKRNSWRSTTSRSGWEVNLTFDKATDLMTAGTYKQW